MRQVIRALLTVFVLSMPAAVTAQQSVWIQIEAHPDEPTAVERADAFAAELAPVEGYRLRSGWYAITIGPMTSAEAAQTLRLLRSTRRIPSDSYLVDGSTFRAQFWPPEGAVLPRAETVVAEPLPEPEPGEETPAEARRSEALLTREERMELQSALAWEGFYRAAIDGAIGRGSRNAMAEWQIANGYEATGVLTTLQRRELVQGYRDMLASIGMDFHDDPLAGISIELPLALVGYDRIVAPFVHFEPKGDLDVEIHLISMEGDRQSLAAFYDVIQTLEIVPVEGNRALRRDTFFIEGENSRLKTFVHAEHDRGEIKGYMLVWPAGDDPRFNLVLNRMRDSFRTLPGQVLPDDAGESVEVSPDFLAGLAIRKPVWSRSGVFVSADGSVLTAADETHVCERITLGDGDEISASLSATDATTRLALLSPDSAVRPLAFARPSGETPKIGSDIAVAGFSYGGRLPAPTLTFGTIEDVRGLNNESGIRRLALNALPGDVGGPVLNSGGAMLGVLLPPNIDDSRRLPDGVHFAAGGAELADFLRLNGILSDASAEPNDVEPAELAALAADVTVLVSCWN